MSEDYNRMSSRPSGYSRQTIVPISYTCRKCGFSHRFDIDLAQLHEDVLQEIERRINTGEYQQRMLNAQTQKP